MTKKQIKRLALASYTKEQLDAKKVKRVAKILSRQDLKEYIKILRELEKSKQVTVFVPRLYKSKEIEKKISDSFPGKKIIFQQDPSLMAGLRVENNDLVYELSLNNTLENLKNYING